MPEVFVMSVDCSKRYTSARKGIFLLQNYGKLLKILNLDIQLLSLSLFHTDTHAHTHIRTHRHTDTHTHSEVWRPCNINYHGNSATQKNIS